MFLFKEIKNEKISLFERNNTDEISCAIKMNISYIKENRDKYYFVGRIPDKSLLVNLTVNCCINNISINLIDQIELFLWINLYIFI